MQTLSFVPIWSQSLQDEPAGLSLARERGWLLAWDKSQWLYLVNQSGQIQGQIHFPEPIGQCALAENAAGAIVIGAQGRLRWLAPDLTTRWERTLENPLTACAVDPFGQFLVLGNNQGDIYFLDAAGKTLAKNQSPRPLQLLRFVPELPLIVGCADFGLIAAFDSALTLSWRETLVTNIGDLSVNRNGSAILLACFSEGLYLFDSAGKTKSRIATPVPCGLVSQSFEGDRILVGGLSNQLFCLDRTGQVLGRHALESPVRALVFDAKGGAAFVALQQGGVVKLRIVAG